LSLAGCVAVFETSVGRTCWVEPEPAERPRCGAALFSHDALFASDHLRRRVIGRLPRIP
jgi:hypothetical protein